MNESIERYHLPGVGKMIIVLLLLQIQVVYAVDNLRLPDIRSLGMGGNGVTQSVLFNPALITLCTGKTVYTDYFNRYGLKELGTFHIGYHHSNGWLPVGVDISSFGYDKYRESMFRLSVGKQLSEKWHAGVSIQYRMLQTELFEEVPKELSADVGLLFAPVDKLFIGLLIMNFPSVSLHSEDTRIEYFPGYSVQVGFQYNVINNLLIAGTAESNKDKTITGSAGIEYVPFDRFRIRAGIRLSPLLPTMGVGYSFFRFTVDAAAIYHPVLGVSTGLGLKYTF